MNRTDALYQSFLDILREELVPAMGCTELPRRWASSFPSA